MVPRRARAVHSGAAALLRRRRELLAGPGHRRFPVGAGLLPALAADRHGAAALALAAVVAGRALAGAGVLAGTAMGGDGGAGAHAGAVVARPLAVALAGVEAAADMRVLEPGAVIRLGGLGGVQRPLQAGPEQRAGDGAAEGGGGQPAEVAAVQLHVLHTLVLSFPGPARAAGRPRGLGSYRMARMREVRLSELTATGTAVFRGGRGGGGGR